jgi:murein L,D-transpeptidase YafK
MRVGLKRGKANIELSGPDGQRPSACLPIAPTPRALRRALRILALVVGLCVATGACRRQATEGSAVRVVAPTRAATLSAAPAAPSRMTSATETKIDNSRPLKLPLVNPKILVRKKERRLTLYSGGEAVREFPVALGFSPEGDKARQGDGRTPEGAFYVCVKNERSAFHLSLGLSYPNAEDAERGLRDELITRRQYERIVSAIKNRRRPPWDTRLGGEIFIHGHGSTGDWTWGCVALENEAVKELFDAVLMGTTVIIEP